MVEHARLTHSVLVCDCVCVCVCVYDPAVFDGVREGGCALLAAVCVLTGAQSSANTA
jgi:hypothetical protein